MHIACLDTESTSTGISNEILELSILNEQGALIHNQLYKPKRILYYIDAAVIIVSCDHQYRHWEYSFGQFKFSSHYLVLLSKTSYIFVTLQRYTPEP